MVVEVLPKFVVAPALFRVRSKKVCVPTSVCVPVVASKVTVPLRGLNVPLLVQVVPEKLMAKLLALTSSVVPEPMVRLVTILIAPTSVLVAEPDVTRLPYFCALFKVATFCVVPEYSIVLVAPITWVVKLDGKVPVPPILSVVRLATVKVPPAAVLLAVNAAKSNIPAAIFRLPDSVILVVNVSVPDALFTVTLLKVTVEGPLID